MHNPEHSHGDDSPSSRQSVVDPACAAAQAHVPIPTDGRRLVAVFASPIAEQLVHFAEHCGFRTLLVEPSATDAAPDRAEDCVVTSVAHAALDDQTDVLITDHDRPELGDVLVEVLAAPVRWVGVIGSVRHTAPHVAALAARGVAAADVARVHRPVGLNIGSRTPAEIAVSTLAGLLADRNGRPGGFTF